MNRFLRLLLLLRHALPAPRVGLRGVVLAALLASPGLANALCVAVCSCNASVGTVVFSPYNPFNAGHDDSAGTISVNCSGVVGLLVPYTLSFSSGGSGTYSPRRLSSGGNRLNYNLYTAPTYATVIGDGTGGTATLSGNILLNALGIGPSDTWTLYGRIPAGQTTAVPGGYTDTLVVTLTYY